MIYVKLTVAGERLFARVFPEHVLSLKDVFGRIPPRELEFLRAGLERLRGEFQRGAGLQEIAA